MPMNREQRRAAESKLMNAQHIPRDKAKKLVYLQELRDREYAPEIPDGTPVKINAARILASMKGLNNKYIEFVKENRDKVFHVSRDDTKANNAMVVLDGDTSEKRWLFHTSDLIVVKEGEIT